MGVKSASKPRVLNRRPRGRVSNRRPTPGYPVHAICVKHIIYAIYAICGMYGQGVIFASAGRVLI